VGRSRTSYVPGKSGNPSGRPRVTIEIRDAARRFGPSCIATLAQMAGLTGAKPVANPGVRVAAMKELLDRGYGKATQVVSGDTNAPLLVDFRWSDATTVVPAPIHPAQLVIEGVAETADAEPQAANVTWAAPE
jgi:hypothetical protein